MYSETWRKKVGEIRTITDNSAFFYDESLPKKRQNNRVFGYN